MLSTDADIEMVVGGWC